MRRPLVALALLAALAPLGRAQDAFKWDPATKRAPKVGYRHTEEGTTDGKNASTVTANGQVVRKEDKAEKIVFKLTREVKAVDKDRATEEVLRVEKWSATSGDDAEADKSLEGQTVVLVVKDGKRTFTLPDDKAGKVSAAARRFIEQYYAKKKRPKADDDEDEDSKAEKEKSDEGDDGMKKALFPTKPVGDGDDWTVDPAIVAKQFLGTTDNLDVEKSSVKGKLTNVRTEKGAHFGHIEVKVSLKLKGVPGTPMPILWTKGGVFEMTATFDGSVEPEKYDGGTLTLEGGLAGKAKMEGQGGAATVDMDVHNKVAITTTPIEEK